MLREQPNRSSCSGFSDTLPPRELLVVKATSTGSFSMLSRRNTSFSAPCNPLPATPCRRDRHILQLPIKEA